MTAAEVAAALYAFSDLMDEAAQASGAVIRDELSFVVARYGMVTIERVAEWLTVGKSPPIPEILTAPGRRLDRPLSRDRLTWCQRQVTQAFGMDGA
jgi:hypothetical protein